MKLRAALAVRREVNHLRRAGLTDRQIASALTRLQHAAPHGPKWVAAGVGPRWDGPSVTRFMEVTRHFAANVSRPVVAAGAAHRKPGFVRAVFPSP